MSNFKIGKLNKFAVPAYDNDEDFFVDFRNPNTTYENLYTNRNITINNITVSPMCVFVGSDVPDDMLTWTDRITGTTLTLAGTGNIPCKISCPFTDDATRAVQNNSTGRYYLAPNTTFADIGTEDIFIEMVTRDAPTASGYTFRKFSGVGNGYFCRTPSNTTLELVTSGSTTSLTRTGQINRWVYSTFYVDRDENSTNGSSSGINGTTIAATTNMSARSATLSNATTFTLMGTPSATSQAPPFALAYLAIYKQSNWFAGGTRNIVDWNENQKLRMFQLFDLKAKKSTNGTYYPRDALFSTGPRTIELVKNNSLRCYHVAQHWPPIQTDGFYSEPANTNRITYSEDFSQSVWSKANVNYADGYNTCFDVGVSKAAVPPAIKLSATTTNDIHRLYHNATAVTVSTLSASSIFAKAGEYRWLAVSIDGYGAAFDLVNGVIDNSSLPPLVIPSSTSEIKEYADGWYRCIMSNVAPAVGATQPHAFYIGSGTTIPTWTFAGNNIDGLYLYAPMSITGGISSHPGSWVQTTASATARALTLFVYQGNQAIPRPEDGYSGTMEQYLYVENSDAGNTNTGWYAATADSSVGTGGNFGFVDVNTGNKQILGYYSISAVLQASIIMTNQLSVGDHKLKININTSEVNAYLDDVLVGTDNSISLNPRGNDLIYISGRNGVNLPAKVKYLKIWKDVR